MKKIAFLIMSVGLLIALAACGGKEKAAEPTAPSAAAGGKAVLIKASNFQFDQQEYHVKKGEPVTITLENAQGFHGVQIKEFNVNLDKSKKTITFTPDKTGSFPVVCSIMCGQGHPNMKSVLIVE